MTTGRADRVSLTHTLTESTFVLERRINEPPATIGIALTDGRELTRALARDEHGVLMLDGPLRLAPHSLHPSWRATGQLVSARGRPGTRIAVRVELRNDNEGRLYLRPLAPHPERWGRRRLRAYFGLAPVAADQTVHAIRNAAARRAQDHAGERRLVHAY
jgi:hypothetical protein